MDPATVEAIVDAARNHWSQADDLEITLEANPNSAEAARFADLALAGVNRISLGLQSFEDEALAFLGRAHSAEEGIRALDAAQSAVSRVSFDLIYALPGDTERGWSTALDRALSLGTEHLSLYQLTIEPGTRFATMVAKHAADNDQPKSGGNSGISLPPRGNCREAAARQGRRGRVPHWPGRHEFDGPR